MNFDTWFRETDHALFYPMYEGLYLAWRTGYNFGVDDEAAQQSVQLTALRRWLALSIFINVVLLAVAIYCIGGR